MDLNIARDRIAKNELTTGDFRYVIHQVPYTEQLSASRDRGKLLFLPDQENLLGREPEFGAE